MPLNEDQIGALSGALGPAGEAAAGALGGLLGRAVTLAPAGVSPLAAADLADKFFGSVVALPVTLSGAARGAGLVAFNESTAGLMADILVGGDGSNPPEALNELHLSALGELGGQLASALGEGLGSALGRAVAVSGGELAAVQAQDLPASAAGLGAALTALEFSLEVEGGLPSPFVFVVGEAVAASLAGGAAAPAPAAAPTTGGFGGTMNAPVVQAAQLSQLTGGLPAGAGNNLELLMDVPLRVTVELGRTEKLVKEVLALGPGSVLELDKLAGEPVDILVNEKRIATGEVVVIDENFGIRVTEIIAPRDRVSF